MFTFLCIYSNPRQNRYRMVSSANIHLCLSNLSIHGPSGIVSVCMCSVVLPTQPYQKRAAAMSRRRFAAGTHSDHMALLRAFQVSTQLYYSYLILFFL